MRPILHIEQLNVSYNGTKILNDLSLELQRGEILGIVGESGSGKSTFLKAVMGFLGDNGRIDSGTVTFDGIDLRTIRKEELRQLHGARMGMVFQHPGTAFNPIRKIGVQFYEAMRAHGTVQKPEATQRILQLFGQLGLKDGQRILKSYPFELSGGMQQRVAIALAMVMHPEMLLCDEPTSALDVTIQAQCVGEMMKLRDELNTTILVVTHNMGVVSYMADKIAVMYGGTMVEFGRKIDVMTNPRHPYTKALIKAIPVIGGGALEGIPGCPPTFGEQHLGCPFAPRCQLAEAQCSTGAVAKQQYENGHWALCPYGC